MATTSDDDNALARAVQHAFPLVPEPFAALGAELGLSPARVLRQVRAWMEGGQLREISAVLEGSALGYESALVAGAVPEDRLDEVGHIINEHPTITHNYVRDHAYNLWFTLAVPHSMGIEATLERLSAVTGIERYHPLRRTETFKIGVNFDLKTRRSCTAREILSAPRALALSPRDEALFRALQVPLELEPRPFAVAARRAGISEDELLRFAREHHGGAIRRYVGTFRHRRLGVGGNGMAVWDVPEERHTEVGLELASAPEVSHCYARNPIEGFPYTVYSMIHGPDEEAVLAIVEDLAARIGIEDRLTLFSTRELKKCRLRYFLPELDEWWARHSAGAAA